MFNLAAKDSPLAETAANSSPKTYPAKGTNPKIPPTPAKNSPSPIDMAKTATGGAKYLGFALAMCDLVNSARQAPVSKNCLASFPRLALG